MGVDKEVEPTKMRAATVSPKEMKNIRMVKEVGRISLEWCVSDYLWAISRWGGIDEDFNPFELIRIRIDLFWLVTFKSLWGGEE